MLLVVLYLMALDIIIISTYCNGLVSNSKFIHVHSKLKLYKVRKAYFSSCLTLFSYFFSQLKDFQSQTYGHRQMRLDNWRGPTEITNQAWYSSNSSQRKIAWTQVAFILELLIWWMELLHFAVTAWRLLHGFSPHCQLFGNEWRQVCKCIHCFIRHILIFYWSLYNESLKNGFISAFYSWMSFVISTKHFLSIYSGET